MSKQPASIARLRGERGVVLYVVALMMVVFPGVAAMAIDYGIWFTDLPPREVPHPMLVPAPVEGREGRASSGTRATA